MRRSFVILGTTLALAGAARAAPELDVRRAVVRVTVIPEARSDVAVSVVRANPHLPLRISREGDRVIVDGGLGLRRPSCHTLFGRPIVSVFGAGEFGHDNMPEIVARVPLNAAIGAEGAVFGSIGPGAGVNLNTAGCGDWTIADQKGPLRAHTSGSGDVRAGSAGATEAHLTGSGDFSMAAARGGLDAEVAGSGDVSAARVDGPLHVRVAGSGDVRVKDGAVGDMQVAVSGSGDVRFGGVAGSLTANVAGSGDVSAARVTGAVVKHVSGSGSVSAGR